MIEIIAKFVRTESAMYATGENVECLIEFKHTIDQKQDETSHNNSIENLAWASVQLHCYRKTTIVEKKLENPVNDLTESLRNTALDAASPNPSTGEIIISTKPKIIFCDLKLRPLENKTYFFSETIPRNGPPTYRGHDIKYFYKIIIATQRVKSKVQTLTVPIRVLPIPIIARPDDMPGNDTNDELTPTNPFIEKREITELELSWHHLKNLTARRLPKFYRITNKRGYVGRVCLFKPAYRLGEDIVVSLDFANNEVRCVQFSVKLQSEEILTKNSLNTEVNSTMTKDVVTNGESLMLNDAKTKNSSNTANEQTGKITTFSTCHEVCLSVLQSHIVIPIPLHVTPSFTTDMVDQRWRLHFEFVTSQMMDFGVPNADTGEWTAPSEIPVETMIWNLPINIYTANPLQIFTPSSEYFLTIK